MTQYLVTWEIEIEADSPKEAAQEALEIQRDRFSEATAFHVERQSDGTKEHIWLSSPVWEGS